MAEGNTGVESKPSPVEPSNTPLTAEEQRDVKVVQADAQRAVEALNKAMGINPDAPAGTTDPRQIGEVAARLARDRTK